MSVNVNKDESITRMLTELRAALGDGTFDVVFIAAVLGEVPSAFLSVSGAAAAPQGQREAESYRDAFLARTGWRPDMSACVGGALLYTKYSWLTRTMMRFASRVAGRPTDTSRDYDLTDWRVVDGFADDLLNLMVRFAATA